MQNQIDIAAFGPEHLDGAVALSRGEHWPHRHEDWMMLQHLSEGVVAVDADGRVVGTTFMTPYGQDYAMINLVIVDKAMRGLGLGRKLMEHAIALAGNRPQRLTATQEGLPLYEKLGFVATGTICQHQGKVQSIECPDGIEIMSGEDIDGLKALDREALSADRSRLIDAIIKCGEVAVARRDGKTEAWAAIRPFGRGEVIGPVIAKDFETARSLIAYHASSRAGRFLRVDTGKETGLSAWLDAIGLPHGGGGVTMRRPLSNNLAHDGPKVFALASQALG
ncbi:GNAT family N-acetyltransferase [Oryzifoliimicrobium ureilyticus]|uniref:GNAT family N-acetyltransferase n=1 Tax=Oryzifoliimicrobium ureilyticus TaxID=3113724 RepID=UPI003075EF44